MPARAYVLVVALGLALCTAANTPAAVVEGLKFPDTYAVGNQTLTLNCAALLRYLVFVRAYVAALYLGPNVKPADVLADVPKRLEIAYILPVKKPDFIKTTEKGIAANVAPATLTRLRPQIDQIDALYEDVKPGDRYAFTYIPGVGTELALNGERKGMITGAEFGAALFSIWLGPQPLDATLKSDLLKCA
jgi:hypothetical protein